ncbi:MAG: hypothetical protein HQM16_06780 [Deltaproteobacteria bacterium]|nr:hypothetical protein [Deltaproteobacteria bacterium]
MLNTRTIKKLFKELNNELLKKNIRGEIGICGGAVMCLVFNARKATKDIDGIFAPTKEIRAAARRVAQIHGLDEGWLNDAAKAFFYTDPPRTDVMAFSNLNIWAPRADYMLAMKAISARFDTQDKDDLIFLIQHLELKSEKEVFNIILKYYPKNIIPPKTQFLIEELLDDRSPLT